MAATDPTVVETTPLLADNLERAAGPTKKQKLKTAVRLVPGRTAMMISNIWIVNVLFTVIIAAMSFADAMMLFNCPVDTPECLFGNYFMIRDGLSAVAAGMVLTRWYRRFVENHVFIAKTKTDNSRCSTSVLMGVLLLALLNASNIFMIYGKDRSDSFIWKIAGICNTQVLGIWFIGGIVRLGVTCFLIKRGQDKGKLIVSFSKLWRVILPLVLINAAVTVGLMAEYDWSDSTNEIVVREVIITSIVGLSGFGSMFGSMGIVGKKTVANRSPPPTHVVYIGSTSSDKSDESGEEDM